MFVSGPTSASRKPPKTRASRTPGGAPPLPSPPQTVRFTLPNGLETILIPLPDAEIVSSWVWYRIGSSHEHPGVTGAAHWLEHMLFKGTRSYGVGEIDRAIIGVGGNLNAFTDLDFTAYITVVPRQSALLPLAIESERMTGATLPAEELDKERNVVLSERDMNENTPEFRMEEELFELAFRVHPYRWNTLGYAADIQSMDREKLVEFYQEHYGPANATLVLSGGFDPVQIRTEIEARFGGIENRAATPPPLGAEPPQRADRTSTLVGPGSSAMVRMAWHAPEVRSDQAHLALLLGAILGGEAQLYTPGYTWGRSKEHPSSLLYRDLVDTNLAVSAGCDWQASVCPGLFSIHARASPRKPVERLEEAIRSVVEKVRSRGFTAEDLREAKQKFLVNAGTVWSGTTMVAFRFGYFRSLGSLELEQTLLQKVLSARRETVNAFAKELLATGSTLVRYLPEEPE